MGIITADASHDGHQLALLPSGPATSPAGTVTPEKASRRPSMDISDPFSQSTVALLAMSSKIGPNKKRWWQKNEITSKPDAELRLEAGFHEWFLLVLIREILPVAGIITAMVFASTSKLFDFRDTSLLGLGIDIDLQLALVGFLNKILDTAVQASLKHTASVCLTSWMACDSGKMGGAGASLIDFELRDELVQPWTCVINFCKRLGRQKIGWRGSLRFVASLAVSVCVLLLALAINTLGIPKERWYPNLTTGRAEDLTISSPRMALNGMDWMNSWGAGFDLVGSGGESWAIGHGLSAASAFTLLSGLPATYRGIPNGWVPIPTEQPGFITAMNTAINGSTVESVSVQKSRVRDVFTYQQLNGTKDLYKVASGWNGIVNITVPMLTTTCISGLLVNPPVPIGTMPVHGPSDTSITESVITISIGAIPLLNFTGATCTTTLRQVLFPVGTWIVNMRDVDVSINNYGAGMNSRPVLLESSPGDRASAQALAIQLGSVVGSINGLIPVGLVYEMVLMSRRLGVVNPGLSPTDDIAGMAPIVAAIGQHLLTSAVWDMTPTDERTTSYPIRWQVYGAGPRLQWEWATAIIIAVILAALLGGAIMKVIWRIRPGPWLEVGGMMLVANESEKMESLKGSCGGEVSGLAKSGKYFLRDEGKGGVKLTDREGDGEELKRDGVYASSDPVIEHRRDMDWGMPWRAAAGSANGFLNIVDFKRR